MITEWPHQSPYAEAEARLRDAITVVANQAATQMDNAARDHVSNNHATNIRGPIDTLMNEGAGLVDAAASARISGEGLS